MATLNQINAGAVIPDQLTAYVKAVSGLESSPCGDCILHRAGPLGVLAAYPLNAPEDSEKLNEAVAEALRQPGLEALTVLAASVPAQAPGDSVRNRDRYWMLPLPLPAPGVKLRNMLRRGGRECEIVPDGWSNEHEALVREFCARKKMDDGTNYIFARLGDYLRNAPDAALFSARNKQGNLLACAIGDYTAFSTAFYMFAFRASTAPPGCADALLAAIAREGARRGHGKLNLGLGIDSGVEFFKKKWGAVPWLPYVETSWKIKKPGWLGRLFGKKR